MSQPLSQDETRDLSPDETRDLKYKIREVEEKLVLCGQQALLLHNLMEDLDIRLQRAEDAGRESFAEIYQMRLSILDRVLDIFIEYGENLGDEINKMEEILSTYGHPYYIDDSDSEEAMEAD